jgi:nucleotide-binding universal stress UspA family protein
LPLSTWEDNTELLGGDISAFKLVSEVYLDGVVKRLKADGFDARAEQLIGNATEEIIRYVTSNPTQLIVMATHGRSGFNRLVFGSVTENIIRAVKVPILLIKPKP